MHPRFLKVATGFHARPQYPDGLQVAEAKAERESEGMQLQIAVTGSLIANIVLAIIQVYAAVTSLSLSLFTTMADAIFDPLRYLPIPDASETC